MAFNTFSGALREFPAVGIDRFNIGCEVYVLTHAHSDHLVGLDRVSFNSIVYCTEITKRLVSCDVRYRQKAHLLRPLTCNVTHHIQLEDGTVDMVLVPSYHCPGSAMVLVYDDRQAILFTGDIKCESWWIELSIRNNSELYGFLAGNRRTLDCIYIDSTFGYRGEPYIEMPYNDVGIRGAILLLQMYPKDDAEISFCLRDTILGFEECWAKIQQGLDGVKLDIPLILLSRLKRSDSLADPIYGGWIRSTLNGDYGGSWSLKVGYNNDRQSVSKFNVMLQQCIDFNLPDLVANFWPIDYNTLVEDPDLKLNDTTSKGNQIFEYRGRSFLKPKGRSVLLPSSIKIVFSRHSSYSEIKDLIDCFNPKQVYPCLYLKQTWKNGFSMKRLFLKCCSGSAFVFDDEMRALYGPLHSVDREVVTINRWDFSHCQSEVKFILNATTGNNFKPYDFIGQKSYNASGKDSKLFPEAVNLEKLISGRNEERYKKWINEQQVNYRGIQTNENGIRSILNYENKSHSNSLTQEEASTGCEGSASGNTKGSITDETHDLKRRAPTINKDKRPKLIRKHSCRGKQWGILHRRQETDQKII
ncbi:uncharacterized protein KQ657_005118 [Scheffersomyces spartinae]|uniref:DNA repair metallo-beta-lactamase domain-containing protein n=1 Tax=Scheffersomyces spartinae TaxID=45513 RepID=A0A9P8AIJ7_9ASCO|nr:uncharacterized protein KQ657_005118 [Scheffersomyces spartinae]KAG7193919.1 hypothetical protein KQ657_005118 [Scheffersomyces spartinae]